MTEFSLERAQTIPSGIEQVFRFFSDPHNLEEITPPWLRFHLTSCSTESVREGTVLEYKLRIRGLPVRWRSMISAWEPPHRFVDEQVSGPYRSWIHEHRFEARGVETRATDVVHYSVPGGAWINRLFVRPDLERIFEYRNQRLAGIFRGTDARPEGSVADAPEPEGPNLRARD